MGKHFFESLQKKTDFQKEYEKLEHIVVVEKTYNYELHKTESINSWIEEHFREWPGRQNFTTFAELREHLGFSFSLRDEDCFVFHTGNNINTYFLYCEMIINLMFDIRYNKSKYIIGQFKCFIDTARYVIEKAGFEIRQVIDEYQIVEKNAVAIQAVETIPELDDVIIEYNHYLLKGNLVRKQELLKKIADAMEPKRKIINGIDRRMADDFFMMVNNLNIRHNNTDPSDKNYRPRVATMNKTEIEKWYDLIYEQAISIFVLLKQQERNKIIDSLEL